MKALLIVLGVVWISSVLGGVIKDQEEPSLETAVDKDLPANYYELFNAPLTDEERQIVGLLERIQTKLETLDGDEKAKFVRKISTRQEQFSSTLNKVESIPGTYNLDVPYLRANLGIPVQSDTIEDIHAEDAPKYEATVPTEDVSSLARAAAANPSVGSSEGSEPVRTLDDVYEVMTILKQLMMVQIVQQQKQEEEEQEELMSYSEMFYNPPRSVRPTYQQLHRRGKQSRARSTPPHDQAPQGPKGKRARTRSSPQAPQGVNDKIFPGYKNQVSYHEDEDGVAYLTLSKRHRRSAEEKTNNIEENDDDEEAQDLVKAYEDWYNGWYTNTYKEWQEVEAAAANFWEENGSSSSSTDADEEASYALLTGMGVLDEPTQEKLKEAQELLQPLNEQLNKLLTIPLDEQLKELGRYYGLDMIEE